MMKKGTLAFVCLLGIVVLLLCGTAGAVAEKGNVSAPDYISRYMSLYDYNLLGQVAEKLCTDFLPVETMRGPIHIKSEEIQYDKVRAQSCGKNSFLKHFYV